MNATTDEVVAVLRERNFSISGSTFDGGTVSALHFGVTDAMGNSAIFEFEQGKLNIYRGKDMEMCILTNTPEYPQMMAINEYWNKIGGEHMLPGTVSSPDRYTVQGEPNVSSTQWRSYANLRDRLYGFELVTNMGYFYVDLNKCDLRKGAPVMRLATAEWPGLAGDATSKLAPHMPFTPMY